MAHTEKQACRKAILTILMATLTFFYMLGCIANIAYEILKMWEDMEAQKETQSLEERKSIEISEMEKKEKELNVDKNADIGIPLEALNNSQTAETPIYNSTEGLMLEPEVNN